MNAADYFNKALFALPDDIDPWAAASFIQEALAQAGIAEAA